MPAKCSTERSACIANSIGQSPLPRRRIGSSRCLFISGPSAGVALYTALVSLLTESCVRADLAMTGKITLRGVVLPVGGIKEKVLAAQRAGIRAVLLPARNHRDWEDIPENVREQLAFHWNEHVEEATRLALQETAVAQPP